MAEANANTFSGGLNMDLDPRLQPKNTYRDANNIKVVNTEGSTMTVQPIGGTAVAIDLTAAPFSLNTGNIVGYYSFTDRLILMHVNDNDASSSNTRIYDFTLNDDGTFTAQKDATGVETHSYVGSINMSSDLTVKIVGILENQTLRRIYWTDNFNPVRTLTLNLDAYQADNYPLTSTQIADENLELLPDMQSRSPLVKKVTSGSLPTGVYQYCVQYRTTDGAESSFSPLSILYHTSSNERGGSAEGEDSGQGFVINVKNPPTNFFSAKLYCLFYSSKDAAVQAMEIGESFIGNGTALSYSHTTFESNFNVNEILIGSNDFDLAKDIAIKDNILFAANTQKRDSIITNEEFDAELVRYRYDGSFKKLRTLSSGEYVRTNQDSGGYRYLPGNRVMKYSRGASGNSSTTSIVTEVIQDTPINVNTTYTWNDTSGNGLPVQDLIVELYNQSIVKENETQQGPFLTDNNYLRYQFAINVQTTSGGGNYWWNGSSWVAQTDELTFYIDGNSNDTFDTPQTHPSHGGKRRAAIYTDLIDLHLEDLNSVVGNNHNIFQINVTLKTISSNAIGTSIVSSVTRTYGDFYTETVTANGLSFTKISFNYASTVSAGSAEEFEKPIRVLGAQSAGFAAGGGVRLTFEQKFKKSDNVSGQRNNSPYMDLSSLRPTFRHEEGYDSNNQTMTKQINLDPSSIGLKSYKRGEIYRLGILFYDKKGNPLNVKYMGDLQIPEAHDRAVGPSDSNLYKPPGLGTTRHMQEDFRLDTIIGQAVPSFCDYLETAKVSRAFQQDAINPSITNQKSILFYPYYPEDEKLDRNFSHWTSDIYIKAEVTLKASTLKKISGFRIVRAERTDEDVTRGFQGLFREGQIVHESISSDAESVLGKTNQSNRTQLKQALDNVESGNMFLNESIRDEDTDHETQETNGNTPVSYIFGSQAHVNFSSISGQSPNYNIRANKGMLYSPESTFGVYNYEYRSTDRILPISVLKIRDNEADKIQEEYGLKNENGNKRRFYGSKNISSSPNRRVYIAKTYTIDTQFFRLLDYDSGLNSDDGYKYYTGLTGDPGTYYSGTNNDQANDIEDIWQNSTHGLALENAIELEEGDTTIYTDSGGSTGTFHNKSFGRLSLTSGGKYEPSIATYDDTVDSNTTYTRVPSIQKGARGIFVECTGRGLIPPNINRAIYDNKLINQTSVLYEKRPYLTLAEIKRDSTNIYGGVSDDALASTRYISASDFVTTQENDFIYSALATGDIFVTLHSQQVTMSHYHPDASSAKWYVFPVETRVNTDMRSGKNLLNGDTIGGFIPDVLPNRNDLLYNTVYSQENNTKGFFYLNEQIRLDNSQTNKIAYSNTKISGEKTDSFRNFPLLQFYDLDNESGEINSIVNFRDDLYALQDRGFAKLYVNSRSLIGSENNILLGSANTIENHSYISKQYGSSHREGVMATDVALYFIDTANEKIHQFTNTLNTISDKGIMKFLSDNLGKTGASYKSKLKSATYLRVNSSEMPLNNDKGVSIGYDQIEKRVIFTLMNAHTDKVSVAYNEYLSAWESKLDFTPVLWISHKGVLFAHGRINPDSGITNNFQRKILTFDNPSDYGNSQDVTKEQFIEVVINDDPITSKKFDALKIIGDVYDGSNVTTLTNLKASTDITAEQTNTFASDGNHSIREGIMKAALRGATATKRLVGSYAKVKITNNNSTKFSIFALIGKIRKSYK